MERHCNCQCASYITLVSHFYSRIIICMSSTEQIKLSIRSNWFVWEYTIKSIGISETVDCNSSVRTCAVPRCCNVCQLARASLAKQHVCLLTYSRRNWSAERTTMQSSNLTNLRVQYFFRPWLKAEQRSSTGLTSQSLFVEEVTYRSTHGVRSTLCLNSQ